MKAALTGIAGAFVSEKLFGSGFLPTTVQEQMKKSGIVRRKLGNTGMELPVVSMGAIWSLNPNLVKAAMVAGVEHFDTAHGYQKGGNEEMLGKVLKDYPRDSYTIGTKLGSEDPEKFMGKLDISLKRLNTDHVDILYTHGASSREDVLSGPVMNNLQQAKKLGKTRHIGLSTHSNEPEVIRAAIESGVYEVIMPAYNFRQDHRDEMAEWIKKASVAGIGIVGMKAMAGGKPGKDADRKMHFRAALKWVLQNPHVHTAITGIRTFEEMHENMAVMNDLRLNREEKEFLHSASLEKGMYCDGCRQCVQSCRKNLSIPGMMRAYMYAYGYGEMKMAKDELAALDIRDNPCNDCSVCTAECKKGFDVPEKLADICRLIRVPDDFLV